MVPSGVTVHLIAGQKIKMLPGTAVQSGGTLHAYITTNGTYCSNPKMVEVPGMDVIEPDSPTAVFSGNTMFRIYPNPAAGSFTLELTGSNETGEVLVDIFGLMGEKVLSEKYNWESKHKFSLDWKPGGIYIVRVIKGSETGTLKLLKE